MTYGKELRSVDSDMNKVYQVIIIGGGPAGLSAGLYTSRSRLNTLLIERGLIGGQIVYAEHIENYPGFPEGVSGPDLGQLMLQQATKYGLETLFGEVLALKLDGEHKLIKTTEGDFSTEAVIITTGCERLKLGVPGEEKFTGRGVSLCATCDAPLFRDKIVAVVGGGDAAITEALSLVTFASSVKVIHRRNELRASKILQERAFAHPKVDFIWDTEVSEIQGNTTVRQLELKHIKTGDKAILEIDGVFIAIGMIPNTKYLERIIFLDETGLILTNDLMETNIPGIFAAGDIRHNSPRQVIAAAGDGATAALSAEQFLISKH